MLVMVETSIESDIRDRASEVLAELGMTIQEATYMLLADIAEGVPLPETLRLRKQAHDDWVRKMVQEALDDPRPPIPGEEVAAEFAERRAQLRARIARGER